MNSNANVYKDYVSQNKIGFKVNWIYNDELSSW